MTSKSEIEALFTLTLEKYGAMIRRMCLSYSTPRASSEDMFQEVMAAIWAGLRTFRGKSALSTWVYRVTINTCLTFLRHYDMKTLALTKPEYDGPANETQVYGKDEYECLEYLLSRLGIADRTIILLWLEERSYEEIAGITGLTRTSVGTRLTRIREQLQRMWNRENSNYTRTENSKDI